MSTDPTHEFPCAPDGAADRMLAELRSLRQMMMRAFSARPLGAALEEIARAAASAAGAMRGALLLLDRAGEPYLWAAVNLPGPYAEAIARSTDGLGAACRRAMELHEPVVIADAQAEPLFAPMAELLRAHGVGAVLSVPILAGDGACLGVLEAYFDRPHAPCPERIERASLYANIAAALVERRSAEAVAIERAKMEEAIRRREEAIAIVSHDLRNPLCAILASASLLQRALGRGALRSGAPEGDRVELCSRQADFIRRSAERMARLIDDLLDLAQIQAGRFHLERQTHRIADISKEALESVQCPAAEKSISLEWSVTPPEAKLGCDRERLLQALGNLLGNAIKFTPEGGSVRLSAVAKGWRVRFEVKDTGIGIPKEHLGRIFDRYWQARNTPHAGVGLGLSITKGIVEAHGGRLWVESALGAGTSFFFDLPVVGAARPAEIAAEVAEFYDLPVPIVVSLLERAKNAEAWEPGPAPGTGLIPLSPGGRLGGARGFLVRVEPGATFPYHEHRGDEHLFILQGGLRDEDGTEAWEGEKVVYRQGTGHAPTAFAGLDCIVAALDMPPSPARSG
jgi:signal transduction histidine kinase